ncbi:MAG: hypothetical protein U0235_13535 [Polyangiaceae bacterium]
MIRRPRHGRVLSVLALAAATLASACNTSGLKKVYMAPDSQGTIDRLSFVAGAPIFCIADVAIGDPKATVQVSMQPVSVNGKPTGLPPLVLGEHIPGKFTGKIATEFPKTTIQAVPDPRDPNKFVTSQAAQAPGIYRCVVRVDDELDYTDFAVTPGQQPTQDPNAPTPGDCRPETVGNCPLVGGGNVVRCCTQSGACGTGPEGTGFCYPSN